MLTLPRRAQTPRTSRGVTGTKSTNSEKHPRASNFHLHYLQHRFHRNRVVDTWIHSVLVIHCLPFIELQRPSRCESPSHGPRQVIQLQHSLEMRRSRPHPLPWNSSHPCPLNRLSLSVTKPKCKLTFVMCQHTRPLQRKAEIHTETQKVLRKRAKAQSHQVGID